MFAISGVKKAFIPRTKRKEQNEYLSPSNSLLPICSQAVSVSLHTSPKYSLSVYSASATAPLPLQEGRKGVCAPCSLPTTNQARQCELTDKHDDEVEHLFYQSVVLLNNVLREEGQVQR